MPRTNDNQSLVPNVDVSGRVLEFDWPTVSVGVAEYAEGPTGCTVIRFGKRAACEADARGGAVGMLGGDGHADAICFAGGSYMGIEACTGVAAELFAARRYNTVIRNLPAVAGAIVYDYGPRFGNAIYPDKALGRAATRSAKSGVFPLGPVGAGRLASVGRGFESDRSESSGQGAAFRQIGPTKLLFVTVVNAIGVIVGRDGQVVRGHVNPETGDRERVVFELERRLQRAASTEMPQGNTTLSMLLTNQKLEPGALRQLGRSVHSSMARAIQPFHTENDGDVLFCVSTEEANNPDLSSMALALLGAELAWDAILSIF